MKTQHWAPVLVFLGVAIPLVLLMNLLQVGGDYRVWIALAAGVAATAYTQSRLARRGNDNNNNNNNNNGDGQA